QMQIHRVCSFLPAGSFLSWSAAAQTRLAVGAACGRPGLEGRRPPGGAAPRRRGGIPPGAKTISFSAEKETVLDSKEKVRPGLRWVGGRRRRLSSLRTVVRTSPGRYGHA